MKFKHEFIVLGGS